MLKSLTRAGSNEGHFLKMVYPTRSKGEGADCALIFLITLVSSLTENWLQSSSTSGGEGVGIHSGRTKVRGSEWYTSEKKDVAASSPNVGSTWPDPPSRISLAHCLKSLWHFFLAVFTSLVSELTSDAFFSLL